MRDTLRLARSHGHLNCLLWTARARCAAFMGSSMALGQFLQYHRSQTRQLSSDNFTKELAVHIIDYQIVVFAMMGILQAMNFQYPSPYDAFSSLTKKFSQIPIPSFLAIK
jgi:hypothetical protein